MKFLGSARLATKSQITIPKTVRELLELKKGEDLLFLQDERGLIYITKEVEIKIKQQE